MNGIIGDPQSDWHRPEELPKLLAWKPRSVAYLKWCRVHNGEFQTPRKSAEGVLIPDNHDPQLIFTGRAGDSLSFSVAGATPPVGFPAAPPPGFRYDIAPDDAITLPELVAAPPPALIGGLDAFPFFAWACPGAPILPRDLFAPVLSIAMHLATHCRYEDALKWLELAYRPLGGNNTWSDCGGDEDHDGDDDGRPIPILRRESRCCCPSEPVSDQEARRRAILMAYLDILGEWTDALMRKNTPEAFQRARLLADTARRILGDMPETVIVVDEADGPAVSVAEAELACAPLNPRLMCLYERVSDRLDMIHACLNARRLRNGTPNLDMPYFGNDWIRECWKIEGDICLDEAFWCRPRSPYRFLVLIQKAQELAAEVRSLGAQLLSAYEKGDAEYLSQLRVRHERQLNDLTLQIRQDQWREADWQVQALEKAKTTALTNLQYYRNLIAIGLLSGEAQYEPLTITSTSLRTAANVVEGIGQAMNLIPDPNVGFPCSFVTLPPGAKLASIFAAAGTIVRTAADIVNTVAGLGLTKDGWERREDEWEHQVDIFTIEVEQIERQILAAERRRAIALRELNNHRQIMQNSAEVHDFLRDKFTNHTLYLWLQKETAALHHRMYELALHCAYQAERAFNFERGHTAARFVPADAWDSLHEGLLSGERLSLPLKQMEKAYYDRNLREYEITKHISLRQHFPAAFLQLRATGRAEIEIPEWLYDLDYPGHYMRRIKSVSVSIPSVVGPYTGVHCRLTLLSSVTRVSPELLEPYHRCCGDEGCNNGYPPLAEDGRIVRTYAATEAIATSSGQADSGMFELNFQDQRYLPFEYHGAVSRWRIELPHGNNHFDMESLTDFVLHLRYMAREGGEMLRLPASECAKDFVPGKGMRFIDAKRELGGQWRSSRLSHGRGEAQFLGLPLTREMFPFLTGNRRPSVLRLEILFEAPDARPSTHHTLTFFKGQRLDAFDPDTCKEDVFSIRCVGDAAWPGFYHGVLEIEPLGIGPEGHTDLGVIRFPPDVMRICNVYLLFGYEAVPGPGKCAVEPEPCWPAGCIRP